MLFPPDNQWGVSLVRPERLDEFIALLSLAGVHRTEYGFRHAVEYGTARLGWILALDNRTFGGPVVHLRDLSILLEEGP